MTDEKAHPPKPIRNENSCHSQAKPPPIRQNPWFALMSLRKSQNWTSLAKMLQGNDLPTICPSAGVSDGINISDVNRRCFMALSHDTPNSCPKSISISRCWHYSYHYILILFSAGVKLGENRINEKFQRESRTPSRGCAAWLQPAAAPCVRSYF